MVLCLTLCFEGRRAWVAMCVGGFGWIYTSILGILVACLRESINRNPHPFHFHPYPHLHRHRRHHDYLHWRHVGSRIRQSDCE